MFSTLILALVSLRCADAQKTTVKIGGAPGKYGEIAFKLWASEVASATSLSGVEVTLETIAETATWEADYQAKMATWDIVIAPYTSGKSATTVDLVNGTKPVLVWGGAAESIFAKGKTGVFGTFTPAGNYFDAGLTELAAKMPAGASKKIEFVENDSSFSDAVCKGAIAKAEALGFTHAIAGATKYDRTNTDAELKTVLAPVVAASPPVVVICGHEADTVRVVHAMALDKLCPKAVLCTNCINNPDVWSGDDADLKDHLIMPTQWSQLGAAPGTGGPLTMTKAEFVTKFKAHASNADKAPPTYHQASAFLSGIAVAEALKAMNGAAYNQATFITKMKALNLDTIVGKFKPAANGANAEKPMLTEQYVPTSTKSPKIEIVAPAASKTETLGYPRSACLADAVVSGAAQSALLSLGALSFVATMAFV